MKIGKAEWAAMLITMTILSFAAGFFFGRSTVPSGVHVEQAVPVSSPYRMNSVLESKPESDSGDDTVAEEIRTESAESEGTTEPVPTEVVFPIDINSADKEAFEMLPGIGEVLAQRILDYRNQNGGFYSVEELKNVNGVGDKTYDAIANLVKVVN